MKKIIILGACIAIGSIQQSEAQHKNKVAPPPPPMAYMAPPPPPAPPVPPPPPVPEAPPLPPPPPPVPTMPGVNNRYYSSENYIEIVNNNGYEISVRKIKGVKTVFVQKDGKTQRIKLSTWNSNRKFYEKKYGQLPPPPPPLPQAEAVIIQTPLIQKENYVHRID